VPPDDAKAGAKGEERRAKKRSSVALRASHAGYWVLVAHPMSAGGIPPDGIVVVVVVCVCVCVCVCV
jgi:hypothetical protein